ncbi:YqzE family protein [Paenibacillus thermotolerans]|uniref:YqzE family protein n=1 Tax=Paenibacillus thermotolerans TaxID=3027807 RepID=UPI002367DD4C|nr:MULTISPECIES: YqzE family protein [unclassified Paenibacillus]
MMAKGEELVKYITQRVVTYIDLPPEQRKQRKLARIQSREPWHYRYFGMIPMAIKLLFRNGSNKKAPSDGDA